MTFSNANDIITERLSIVDVVSRYVKLTKSGGGFKGLCPFHSEKTPSFNVNEERQYYYCFGCHASGNAITFIMNIESLNFVDAVKKLASDYNIPELVESKNTLVDDKKKQLRNELQRVNKLAACYFHKNLLKNREALDYLNENRGISRESLKEFGLGYASSGNEFISFMREKGVSMEMLEKASLVRAGAGGRVYSFFHNRIMFPIVHSRKVAGFGGRIIKGDGPKYLNSADTPLFNKRRQLYGYDTMRRNVRNFPFIIVTEGYFDVISLWQAGIKTAVASLGTAVTSDHLTMLSRHRSPVILLLDGDEAGRRAADKVLELVMPEDIDLRVAFIPEKGEDPDSIVRRENGREELVSLVKEALPLFQKELDRIIAEYNSTVNLEIRIKLRKKIKELLSRVPSVKFYHYAEYVIKHTDIRRHMFKMRKKKGAYSKNTNKFSYSEEKKARKVERLLHEIFYLACSCKSLIPSLECMRKCSLLRYDTEDIFRKLFESHDEGEFDETIPDRIKDSLSFEKKYEGMDFDDMERNIRALILRFLIMENEEKQKIIAFEDGENEKQMKLKLLEKKKFFKRELDSLINTL